MWTIVFRIDRTICGSGFRQAEEAFFRLTNFFRPDNILEIGTSWGISTLYLRLAGRQSEITVVEPLPEVHDFAESLFAEVGEKADFVREEYATFLLDYFRQTPERLYIVVNRLPKPYYRALPICLPLFWICMRC